jgi:hypothetical protein
MDTISAHSGYTSGGQELTITGYGLTGASVGVTVDGVDCVDVRHSLREIKCTTGAASQASTTGVDQPGQPGITRRFVNTGDAPGFDNVDNF